MVTRDDPYILSIEKGMTSKDNNTVSLVNISKPLFFIKTGGSKNPHENLELNRDSRRYIHVRQHHHIKRFDEDGKLNEIHHYHPVHKCSKAFLNRTEYERKFYNT